MIRRQRTLYRSHVSAWECYVVYVSTSTSRIPRFFRRIAVKGWRNSPYFTYSSGYPVLRRWLIAKLLARDRDILSIGCGSGELERDLIKLGRQVTGMDICFEMLQSAQRRGVKRVLHADALHLPFVPNAFDLVIFPESIGYFDLEPVLPGVARVLNKQGRVMITAYATNFASDNIYKRRSVAELSAGLRQAGLRVSEHKLLVVSRSRVVEVASEERSQLIYVCARKAANGS
jgi:SAM-dependent methyltransferase